MNGFRKGLSKDETTGWIKLPASKVPEPLIAGSHSGHTEGDVTEECRLENQKLQKITQMHAVMEKSESEFAACRQSLASSYNQD